MNNKLDIIIELTKKEIKIRYKNSYLGYLWSLANPLFMALIYYFVFKAVMRIDMPMYDLFLLSGLFVWQFISNSFSLGSMLFVGNAGLVKKIKFERYFLGIAMILSEGFNFLLSLPILIGFMVFYDLYPTLEWIYTIPLFFLITAVFAYGISLFLGTINLFFRDMERLIGIFMMFSFYATPIFYPIKMIPEKYLFYIETINPFTSYILMWKELILENNVNFHYISVAFVYSLFSLAIGLITYNMLKNKFAELV